MPKITRHIPALVCVAFLVGATSTMAFAGVSLEYLGETPDTGMASYDGDFSSEYLWDYVYQLSPEVNFFGPYQWGIVVPANPTIIYSPSGWSGAWYEDMGDFEAFAGTNLDGQSGIIWDQPGTATSTGDFHFQSLYSPRLAEWQALGDVGQYGQGTQWSATPEPASLVLVGLALVGVGAWRRKRMDP